MKIIQVLLGRLLLAIASQEMLIWALRFAAKRTENQLDDAMVDLIEAGLKNDPVKIREAAKAVTAEVADLFGNENEAGV